VAVFFIDGGNYTASEETTTCRKLQTNFIT